MSGRAKTAAFPGSATGAHPRRAAAVSVAVFLRPFRGGAHVSGRPPGSSTSAGSLRKVCVSAAGVPRTCGCRCALLLPACRLLRARMASCRFPRCARVVTSCRFLRPVCPASRARPVLRGFGVEASTGFHGFGVQRRSGFHGGRSNWSLGRTPEGHLGVNQTFPAGAGELRC